ncbi:MAG: haloacid dehalogenase type II [Nocardioidaceae bacterium]
MSVTVIAFDVNETLLDLSGLDDAFESLFGDSSVRAQWFAQMLQVSFVGGLTGEYVDFRTAQGAALQMVAARHGVTVDQDTVWSVVDQMTTLSPHPEVTEALRALRGTGLTIAALTNSPKAVAEAQVTHAGLADLFDDVLSADTVQALKPAPEPYRHVASTFDVGVEQVRLVAAHSWDISGALAAGCRGAFVARPGAVLSPLGQQPDIVGPDLAGVVEQILATDQA